MLRKRKSRRSKLTDEELSRRALLRAQREYLATLELERTQGQVGLEKQLSRKESKRRSRRRQRGGASGSDVFLRETIRPYPQGNLRYCWRVPTAKAPMSKREYAKYLQSPHWQELNQAYRRDDHALHECFVCGALEYQLHHHTYERIGEELFEDLVPLCEAHHEAVHVFVKARQTPLSSAHVYVKIRFTRGDPLGLRVARLVERS